MYGQRLKSIYETSLRWLNDKLIYVRCNYISNLFLKVEIVSSWSIIVRNHIVPSSQQFVIIKFMFCKFILRPLLLVEKFCTKVKKQITLSLTFQLSDRKIDRRIDSTDTWGGYYVAEVSSLTKRSKCELGWRRILFNTLV